LDSHSPTYFQLTTATCWTTGV